MPAINQGERLQNFYINNTNNFTVTIEYNGVAINITNDTVRFMVKENIDDTDAQAVINVTADVVTQGANGIAIFNLTSAQTDIDPGNYWYEISWLRVTGAEYTLEVREIELLERVEDTP